MSDPNGENLLLAFATDSKTSEKRKIAAIKGLGRIQTSSAVETLMELAQVEGDDPVTLAAIEALGDASR
ncbi:HEAT repeat domain-containing protein [Pseudomonas syringae]|uniref:HEAT repeat domain-containing protein n=1 Tax=Pseudomonas syringae CC1417 TaxID=1357272 RepID=A0AAU8LFR9_PSESX